MRNWEDIVKDKIEEPEGALPESVFAEFRARREAAAAATAPKRFPPVWAVVPAVAAGLAAVLLLHKPVVPEGNIQITQQPTAPVTVVTDTTSVGESEQTTPLTAQAVTPKALRKDNVKQQEVTTVGNTEPTEEIVVTQSEEETVEPEAKTDETKDTPGNIYSPFKPEVAPARPVKMKVGTAAGLIAGGGLLAAVITPFLGSGMVMDNAPVQEIDSPGEPGAVTPDPMKDELIGSPSFCFPLRTGLSARIPLAERLSVTTSLEYSLYSSKFTYTLSGEKTQLAHYLGVPVRLDWTLASGRWLDVYIGGGLEGDYCLGATLAGERTAKDGFGLSLLGAGGIQCNLTKRIGLYVEPEISWTIPSESHVLQTYRSDNPLMFSLTSGIRINIGK